MYSDFAAYYDELMAEVDYPGWADHYASLLERAGVAPGSQVTECACGTGSLTRELAKSYRMTGVDCSQEMLSIAADKLRSGGHWVPLVCQDMRRLRLMRPQDAILATCDGVNYLIDSPSLYAFLKAAAAALRPGGALCFDVSSPYKLSTVLGNNTLTNTQGRVHYIWENRWNADKRLLDLRLQLYARETETVWRHAEETQRQRAWTADELQKALGDCGFAKPLIFGDRTEKEPRENEERWHILAVKADFDKGNNG